MEVIQSSIDQLIKTRTRLLDKQTLSKLEQQLVQEHGLQKRAHVVKAAGSPKQSSSLAADLSAYYEDRRDSTPIAATVRKVHKNSLSKVASLATMSADTRKKMKPSAGILKNAGGMLSTNIKSSSQ